MNLKNLEYIKKNAPATKEEIENVEKHISGVLPKIYKEFRRQENGMDLNLCVLYDTHSIVERYECNEFADYAPGYISIGNDNGHRELIMKAEKGAVLCGFLDVAELGEGKPEEWFEFKSWVENGCEMEQDDEETDGYGKVYILRLPEEKLKFLAETKKIFALSISTGVLYKQVNTLQCVIVRQITEAMADILIQKTSYLECYKFGK